MYAPHLPKKKEGDKETKEMFGRLKVIALSVVLALLAGVTGAFVVLGWVWPYVGEGDTWALSQTRTSVSSKQLESIAKQEMANRIVTVYNKSSLFYNTEYFEPENKLSNAVMIGSDGWLVMYHPQSFTNYKKWKVILNDGTIYEIEKAIKDNYSDLLYIKLSSLEEKEKQFKVVSFSDEDIKSGDEIYVFQDSNWQFNSVKFPFLLKIVDVHLDTAPILTYSLNDNFTAGSVVINRQGRTVGIINENSTLLPYETIIRTMPFVLSESEIEYPSLKIKGWFSEEMPIKIKENLDSGFIVAKVLDNKSLLKIGDVITEIDGQKINVDTYYKSISSQEKVLLRVLRNDKYIEFEALVGVIK